MSDDDDLVLVAHDRNRIENLCLVLEAGQTHTKVWKSFDDKIVARNHSKFVRKTKKNDKRTKTKKNKETTSSRM